MDNILDTLVKYNNQTQGRDKLFRLFQYGSRFLWWFGERYRFDKDAISKLKNLEYSLSTARKLLRLGRSLDTMYGTLKLMHLPDLLLRITLTMAKINQALFFLMDHVVWLGRVGLVNINREKWGARSNKFLLRLLPQNFLQLRGLQSSTIMAIVVKACTQSYLALFWFCSILMLCVRDIYEVWRLVTLDMRVRSNCGASHAMSCMHAGLGSCCVPAPRPTTSNSLHEDVFSAFGPVSRWAFNHKDVVLDTLKNGCDLVIPMTGLGYLDIPPGAVGLCGVVSSIIGIVALIDPFARLQPS